jgi:hypothetical protein
MKALVLCLEVAPHVPASQQGRPSCMQHLTAPLLPTQHSLPYIHYVCCHTATEHILHTYTEFTFLPCRSRIQLLPNMAQAVPAQQQPLPQLRQQASEGNTGHVLYMEMFAVTSMLGISCWSVFRSCRSRIQLLPHVPRHVPAQQEQQISQGDTALGVGSTPHLT